LGVFNTMFLGLEAETLNNSELFGYPGGVSRLLVDNAGRRLVRTLSDLSYLC
jgi:probable phosphoglycerate mutase